MSATHNFCMSGLLLGFMAVAVFSGAVDAQPTLAEAKPERAQKEARQLANAQPKRMSKLAKQNSQLGFSQRLSVPRVAPLKPEEANEAQREMLENRPDFNIYKVLAHHPDLYWRWSPLGQALLVNENISPRHREIAMLRMGWLCQAPYEWAQHARIAHDSVKMSEEEINAIAIGAQAENWSAIDRAVIRMAEEVRYDAMVSDETWAALSEVYTDEQILELVFTASQYQLVSMALNSLGVQLDPGLRFRLPEGLPMPVVAKRPTSARLTAPRVPLLTVETLDEAQKEMVAAQILPNGSLPNIYAALALAKNLYGPRIEFAGYLKEGSTLEPEIRELLILRTAVLTQTEYLWAHHMPRAKVTKLTQEQTSSLWQDIPEGLFSPAQQAALMAADDLRREAFITDAVYDQLTQHFTTQQIIDLVYTVGGYTMTGVALNSLGVPVEPVFAGFPAQ